MNKAIALLLLLVSQVAFAITPSVGWRASGSTFYPTKEEACSVWAGGLGYTFAHVDMPGSPGLGGPYGHDTAEANGKCHACEGPGECHNNNNGNRSASLVSGGSFCPVGSTLTGGECVCNAPLVESGGACVAPACPTKGTVYSSGYYDIGVTPAGPDFPRSACAPNSCIVTFSGKSPAGSSVIGGFRRYYAYGNFAYEGGEPDEACSRSAPSALGSIPANTCGEGQTSGVVNGQFTCVSVATGKPVPAEAQTSTTEVVTVENPDGSTTTTETTVDANGNKTETRTTTNLDGSKTVEREETRNEMDPDNAKMPDADGVLDAAEAIRSSAIAEADALIESVTVTGKKTDLGISFPLEEFIPSAAACTNWVFTFGSASREVDWCPTLARLRALWGWFFSMLVALYIWRRATSSTGE